MTSNLVPCFVRSFKTDSKTGYEKALLVGVFDKTTTDLDCCISSFSRDMGKTRQPVAVVMREDGRPTRKVETNDYRREAPREG